MVKSGALQRVLSVIDVGPWESSSLFIKALSKNDDSGRHGVLIPREAYPLFPSLAGIDEQNPSVDVTTEWNDTGTWVSKASAYRQYDRYPERRLTSLNPSELNRDVPRLMIVATGATPGVYRCVVAMEGSAAWTDLLSLLRVKEFDSGATRILDVQSAGTETSSFDQLLVRLRAINKLGWIPTVRSGDTGVGMTLEASLGLAPNVKSGPDFKGIEIKSLRTAANSKKVTLFAKTPNWEPGGRVKLLDDHGYLDDNGRWSLYHSIYGHRQSSAGWQLRVDDDEGLLYVDRNGTPVVNWDLATLEQRLKEKHTEAAFVSAQTRGKGKDEAFKFGQVTHASSPSIGRFVALIRDGHVSHDFAMHRSESGAPRDHGFLFRISLGHISSLYGDIAEYSLSN